MEKNKIADILRVIGAVEAAAGVLAGGILLSESFVVGASLIVVGIIICVIYFALAEVISLLQESVNIQKQALKHSIMEKSDSKSSQKMILDDIEANLPKM